MVWVKDGLITCRISNMIRHVFWFLDEPATFSSLGKKKVVEQTTCETELFLPVSTLLSCMLLWMWMSYFMIHWKEVSWVSLASLLSTLGCNKISVAEVSGTDSDNAAICELVALLVHTTQTY